MEVLQDFIAWIDPLKRQRRLPQYGKKYVQNILKKVEENEGKIYIAKDWEKVLWIIVGTIEHTTKIEELECFPSKTWRVDELVVREGYRGKDIGTQLIHTLEWYFKEKKCNIIRIYVFEPNIWAKSFYQKHWYHPRVIDMVKCIES